MLRPTGHGKRALRTNLNSRRRCWTAPVVVGAVLCLCWLTGCERRQFYRRKADQHAYRLIDEKAQDPRWALPDYSVYPDSRSRYHDPYDPDRPPMPPDDPDSHQIMHCVYGMKGYKRWHKDGDRPEIENPGWKEYLTEIMEQETDGAYRMKLEDATRLALLHAPQYQRSLEDLYLSALDVAFERFRFDVQFYGGNETTFTHRGSEAPGARGRSSSQLTTQTYLDRGRSRSFGAAVGVQKLLPAGGQLLADYANTFVWQFAGPDRNTTAQSLLSFNLIQPLLRAGGRDIVLERLTLTERALLGNIRQMERFRQGFFINVAYGAQQEQGPQRRGGFLGGAGLTGFTGQGTGGFGGVGEATGFGRFGGVLGGAGVAGGAAGGGFAAGVAVNVGGFYGLVQQLQQIRTRRANLDDQLYFLDRVEQYARAGLIEPVQAVQFRQNVQTARSQHLEASASYERALETFLTRTLGLPPDLPIRVDESTATPFQIVDPQSAAVRNELSAYLVSVRTSDRLSLADLDKAAGRIDELRKQLGARIDIVRGDLERLESAIGQRIDQARDQAEKDRLRNQPVQLKKNLATVEANYKSTAGVLEKVRALLAAKQLQRATDELVLHAETQLRLLQELLVVQGAARAETVVLKDPVRLTSEQAFQVTLANRVDIMNRRAEVVDQWRLIAFNANDLESDLDLVFSGDIGTLDRNIAKFRNQTGSLSVGVRFDAPLTRLGERNEYRQALIDYQRVRRDYIQFQDSVLQGLRDTLRRLEQLEQELELRRQAVRIAVQTVDMLQLQLLQPPTVTPGGGAQAGARFSDTLVRNLLAAYADLLQTQNDLMGTHLNYELLRMQLYRDLGVIQFAENGIWIDAPLDEILSRVPADDSSLPPDCSKVILTKFGGEEGSPPALAAESGGEAETSESTPTEVVGAAAVSTDQPDAEGPAMLTETGTGLPGAESPTPDDERPGTARRKPTRLFPKERRHR